MSREFKSCSQRHRERLFLLYYDKGGVVFILRKEDGVNDAVGADGVLTVYIWNGYIIPWIGDMECVAFGIITVQDNKMSGAAVGI